MRQRNKTVRTLALAVLLVGTHCTAETAQTINTELAQALKVKDFYINRIAANAKDVLRSARFIHAGFALRSISVLGGPLTFAGVMLGDLITGLALLTYGHKIVTTFVAVKRIEKILPQYQKVANFMSDEDWRVLNGGKSVLRGPIINIIHKKIEINKAIKQAVSTVIKMYPELTEIIEKKKVQQVISQYFIWTIQIKTYQEARQKQHRLHQKKKIIPFIKKAAALVDKLIAAPSTKRGIEQRKKKIKKLLNQTYPVLGEIEWFLHYTANKLFLQVEKLKKMHARKFSLFKRKKKREQPQEKIDDLLLFEEF